MEEAPGAEGLDPVIPRALYRRALVRPVLTVTALVGLYYLLPLDRWQDPLTVLALVGGLLAVVGLGALQVRAVLRARYPAVRAAEALAVAIPLFLLLFAAGYSLMSSANPGAFSEPLDRTDAIYFTVTVFATVGFGDIVPVTKSARVVVTLQMVGDLLVLGVLLQAIVGAVKLGRARRRHAPTD
jgi:voltage-gated potassium channel